MKPLSTKGKRLFRLTGDIRWYLVAVTAYALAAIGLTIEVLECPKSSPAIRVLSTGGRKVKQFYSGLALSVLLTPAAIMIRRIAYDLALLHPFAVASTTPVEVADLDNLMDPGFYAVLRLFKYSTITAAIQAFLLAAGSLLVPIGTLLVFTGTYSAPLSRLAVVGLPTSLGNGMSLSIEMVRWTGNDGPMIYNDDFFLNTATNMFVGNIIRQTGVLSDISPRLGPTVTANLTYEEGVRYHGIVTYLWSSGCKRADDIMYVESTEQNAWMFNITFPNGAYENNIDAWLSQISVTNFTSTNNVTTTYYAIVGTTEETVNLDKAQGSDSTIEVINGSWISRVACTPTFDWEVSSCLWTNASMTDCYATPGANTTALDNIGLGALKYYLSDIPLYIYQGGSYTYGLETLQTALMFNPQGTSNHQYRAPVLADYNNMYGLIAQSIVSVTTSGYYGAAEVPSTGSAPKPVYLVRTYVLAVVVAILVLSPLLTTAILLRNLTHRIPLRMATFLTIANAVRGPRWDAALLVGCLMSPRELRYRHRGFRVRYGVDEQAPNHVGFAQEVSTVQSEALYYGVTSS
jgi:hypothetical protein